MAEDESGPSAQESAATKHDEREHMLTKHQIAQILADQDYGHKNQILNILNGLCDLAQDEIEAGEDFTVPGICKIAYTYRPVAAKGERWKAGDEVVGFGGISSVKDTDSPATKAKIGLKASVVSPVSKLKPGTKAPVQSAFLRSKVGKAVAARKGR